MPEGQKNILLCANTYFTIFHSFIHF